MSRKKKLSQWKVEIPVAILTLITAWALLPVPFGWLPTRTRFQMAFVCMIVSGWISGLIVKAVNSTVLPIEDEDSTSQQERTTRSLLKNDDSEKSGEDDKKF
jgi:hypothetical protein